MPLELTPEQALGALSRALEAMHQKTTNPNELQILGRAVQNLAPDLDQSALGPILDVIRQTTDPTTLKYLAQAVQTLGPAREQAQAALGPSAPFVRQTDLTSWRSWSRQSKHWRRIPSRPKPPSAPSSTPSDRALQQRSIQKPLY